MGVKRFFRSLVDSDIMGEEIISAMKWLFIKKHEISNGYNPHEALTRT